MMTKSRIIPTIPRLATIMTTTILRQPHRRTDAPGAVAAAVHPAMRRMPRSTGTRSYFTSTTHSVSFDFAKELRYRPSVEIHGQVPILYTYIHSYVQR